MASYLELLSRDRRRIPIDGVRVSLGRAAFNTISFPGDMNVSRRHAVIQEVVGTFYVADLGSRNGTVVNGRPITAPMALSDGDVIVVGEHEIVFNSSNLPSTVEMADEIDVDATQYAVSVRTITTLVIDVRGYTQLSQRIPEAEMSKAFAAFFQDAGAALKALGCWTQKYIGDAIMAVWVHPGAAADSAEFRPVFEGLNQIRELAGGMQSRFGLPIPIRIGAGINTGVASTGNLGSSAVADFTALGDAVNKAFRLESCTKEIGADIALGEQTYLALEPAPGAAAILRPCLAVLKGYSKPQTVYSMSFADLDGLRATLAP